MLELTQLELSRYQQQLKLPEIGVEGQLKLKAARVLCVGAGGLAAPLLLYLAAAGIGTLSIVDNDQLELSNLQRQILYGTSDLGRDKVQLTQERLINLNPEIKIEIHTERLNLSNATELIAHYDLVADCSDNFATRYLVNDFCHQLKKPLVTASIDRFNGQCTFFSNTTKSPCYRCLFPRPPRADLIPNCAEGGVLGVLPGIVGTIQATEILKWILGIGSLLTERLLTINSLDMSFREFKFSQNPECELCVHAKTATELLVSEYCADDPFISVQALKESITQKRDLLLLDVRSVAEHQESNIGGVLIPLDELTQRLAELSSAKDIVVYCRSGKRSQAAVELLSKANYSSVKYLRGGILAYLAE
ncbi:MAG TPA: molybdopterin-synthase adenylyltransferase MoeB [Coxiellaceae bacterium]|nr:molybdopterin-synthase adenylyltransferase MoeB [Coxiellaceae bacterium]